MGCILRQHQSFPYYGIDNSRSPMMVHPRLDSPMCTSRKLAPSTVSDGIQPLTKTRSFPPKSIGQPASKRRTDSSRYEAGRIQSGNRRLRQILLVLVYGVNMRALLAMVSSRPITPPSRLPPFDTTWCTYLKPVRCYSERIWQEEVELESSRSSSIWSLLLGLEVFQAG